MLSQQSSAGVVGGVQVDRGVLASQVVDAVRDQLAVARAAEVVVEGLDGLLGIGLAGAVEIPQQFLLFRVDADHGVARGLVLLPQPRDVLELGVAVGMVSHRFLLARRATPQLELPQQPSNRPPAGGRAQRRQPPRSSRSDKFVHNTPTRIGSPAVNSSSSCRRLASSWGQVAVRGQHTLLNPADRRVLGCLRIWSKSTSRFS